MRGVENVRVNLVLNFIYRLIANKAGLSKVCTPHSGPVALTLAGFLIGCLPLPILS